MKEILELIHEDQCRQRGSVRKETFAVTIVII